jgi:hypothetical protein
MRQHLQETWLAGWWHGDAGNDGMMDVGGELEAYLVEGLLVDDIT